MPVDNFKAPVIIDNDAENQAHHEAPIFEADVDHGVEAVGAEVFTAKKESKENLSPVYERIPRDGESFQPFLPSKKQKSSQEALVMLASSESRKKKLTRPPLNFPQTTVNSVQNSIRPKQTEPQRNDQELEQPLFQFAVQNISYFDVR